MFALVKRVNVKDENLASTFFSILLSTNTMFFLLPLKFIIPLGTFTPPPYYNILKIVFGSFFLIWYFICKYYFLHKKKCVEIIAFYEQKGGEKNKQMAIYGILYCLLTFISFIVSAMVLSRINWHL